jgi:hypothetical protein
LLRRRYRPIQPNVLSTIHRLAKTTNPLAFADLKTVRSSHPK